jgi:two-component system, OmpR family, sensor histidine kinase KdpD
MANPKLLQVGARVLLLRLAAVAAILAAITSLFFRLIPVNATTAGFAYLIVVLVVAARWGLIEALAASIGGVLCFNFFFFEPVGTFTIADPQNWIALLAFLATAIIASQLSARARARTREAVDRRREMERLYALSRATLLTDPARSASKQIADQIAEIFELSAVALYDTDSDQTCRAGPDDPGDIDDRLRVVAVQEPALSEEGGTLFAPIRLGGQPIGALAMRGAAFSEAALQALLNLVAIGLERVRSQEAASRAEAARQSEELKSTLLDAIAHEFQTPLTAIKASASAMLSAPSGLPEEQRELASIVDEETDQLSRLVREAIQMARIEAGKIQLNKELCPVDGLIHTVLAEMKSKLEGRAVEVSIAQDLPLIFADGELIRLALRQLVANAARYSPPGSPLSISAAREALGSRVVIRVEDRGPGVPEREKARIFEKFYRSPHTRQHVTGSGMGLAISKEILEAHGGEISVENQPGRGSVFSISLPTTEPEKSP